MVERLLGVAAAVGASIAWALNPAFFRVEARGVDAAMFNALRVLSALPFLAALVVGVERLELPSAPEAWLYIAAASIIGVGLGSALAWGFGSIANKLALGYVDPLRLSLLRSVVLAALLTPAR